jgi:hypothetical protein
MTVSGDTLRGIDEQVTKGQCAVDGHAPFKRNRFIKLSGAAKSVNRELEVKARGLAGRRSGPAHDARHQWAKDAEISAAAAVFLPRLR